MKDWIYLKGQWKESERYGKQYHVASFEIQMPTTGEGVKAYLSSGLIKGVGPIIAERIVDRFGKNTFYVFEQCPERCLKFQELHKESWIVFRGVP